MTSTMTPTDITSRLDCGRLFLRAASIIEANGWKRGSMFDNGACCALGAIWLALVEQCPELPKPSDRSIAACRGVTLPVDYLHFMKAPDVIALTGGQHISLWNDKCCQSQTEAVEKLREIATRFA